MVLVKNLKFFHVFIFGKKQPAKEQQAIPSFHGIHQAEFLSMMLTLQFHG